MNPAAQHLIPLLYAAGFSAIGWLVVYMREPAPGFYLFLLRRQREPVVEFCRLAGRWFGMVFAAWTVVYLVWVIVDLVR
jgi:hypothetical protein